MLPLSGGSHHFLKSLGQLSPSQLTKQVDDLEILSFEWSHCIGDHLQEEPERWGRED